MIPKWLEPIEAAARLVTNADLSPLLPAPPEDARRAAVLMLFAEGEQGPDLLFTERAPTLRSHAGQISFPGGALDESDPDEIFTALREANEEVGIEPTSVTPFATLPKLWLPPSNFAVTTVLGYWHEPHEVSAIDAAEVASVFRVPIDELLNPAKRFTVVHHLGWQTPGFDVDHPTPLWGFTAGIVSRLFAAAGWEKPWDKTITRELDWIND